MGGSAPVILTVENLTVRFGAAVVNRVSVAVARGQRVALVGESGCGKTVLALTLLGLLPQNARVEGAACFAGRNLLDPAVARSLRGREIAMCWSNAERYFNPVKRIGAQIDEAYSLHHPGKAREKTLELLRKMGFEDPRHVCDAYPSQLSGGMNQRAMIAMGLINSPSLLLVDEPTRGLDDANRDRVLRCLADLAGVSMLIITHDMGLVEQLAQQVHFMRAGEFLDPNHPYAQELVRAGL
jgi:ABC-type glutathione transport system ATPase component